MFEAGHCTWTSAVQSSLAASRRCMLERMFCFRAVTAVLVVCWPLTLQHASGDGGVTEVLLLSSTKPGAQVCGTACDAAGLVLPHVLLRQQLASDGKPGSGEGLRTAKDGQVYDWLPSWVVLASMHVASRACRRGTHRVVDARNGQLSRSCP